MVLAAILALIAAVASELALRTKSSLITHAIDDALSEIPDLPPEASSIAHAFPYIIVPLFVFLIVYACVGLLQLILGCAFGHKHQPVGSDWQEVVPMGIPVVGGATPYTDMVSSTTHHIKNRTQLTIIIALVRSPSRRRRASPTASAVAATTSSSASRRVSCRIYPSLSCGSA